MTVRISDVVEVRDVLYVVEQNKLGLPCCIRSLSSAGKGKKRQVPVSPVVTKRNNSLLGVRLLAVRHLKLLERSFERSGARKSGHDRRNAPVFLGGIRLQFICIYV